MLLFNACFAVRDAARSAKLITEYAMPARNAYLKNQVCAASQPKLRLMVIQAAWKTAQLCLKHWATPQPAKVEYALTQLRQAIGQLLGSLGHSDDGAGAKLRRVYSYLYRTVAEAQLTNDADKLRDVLRVLEVERNTWRQLSERHDLEQPDEVLRLTPASSPPAPNKSYFALCYEKTKTPRLATTLCLVA